jgi:hypothetical protein
MDDCRNEVRTGNGSDRVSYPLELHTRRLFAALIYPVTTVPGSDLVTLDFNLIYGSS